MFNPLKFNLVDKTQVFHSNAYARQSVGKRIGSTEGKANRSLSEHQKNLEKDFRSQYSGSFIKLSEPKL